MNEQQTEQGESLARIYEVGYHLVPTVTAEDVAREVTTIKDFMENIGARVFSEEFPKLRTLSYEMRLRRGGAYQKFNSAYFGWMKFEAVPETVRRIEAGLSAAVGNLLRFLIVKTVRENTLFTPRAPKPEARRDRREVPKDAPAPAPVSESELDKSLEKLIAE